MIYLDAAATTPVRREVLEAMWPWLTSGFGNPSSQHELGKQAAAALSGARNRVADALTCRSGEIIFTSGGTEADNLAIQGIALANPRERHIVTTPIEHEAVLSTCDYLHRFHNFEITYLPVDRDGRVSPQDFAQALRTGTTLCSVMLANNEIGTVEPIAQLAALAKERGIPFHTDAVQAAGSINLKEILAEVDALSLSGHKLGAPKGTGVLYLRRGIPLEAVLHGGGQERNRRSGTENVAGAVALSIALELAERDRERNTAHLTALRDDLIRRVQSGIPEAVLTGHRFDRLPGHVSFCFPGTSGEAVLLEMEARGVLCSSGSACAAGRSDPSHVLLAIGIHPDLALTAVRFTFTAATSQEDIAAAAAALQAAVASVRELGSSG